ENMGSWKLQSSSWTYPTVVLSLYGFFANCRVAEPFLTPYLIGPNKNISGEVVTNYLFPIWTYSYLAFLFPVFLLTDFLRYKPLIMIQGLFLVTNYLLLCFAPGLTAMIILQVNYAVVTSTEVAYLSYIYSVIPVENYQRATGYLRSAMLTGYTCGAGLGQILVSLAGVDLFYINATTLGIVSMAFLVSFWLPMPQRSLFFKGKKAAAVGLQSQQERPEEPVMDTHEVGSGKEKMERNGSAVWYSRENMATAGHLLWKSFRESHLIYWSLWWALATAGYVQVFNYVQLMWDHIEPSATSSIYNGGVEAACSLVGAAAAFSVAYIKVSWTVWGELALGLFSAVGTGAVYLMAFTSSIWVCYAGYVLFKSCYMLLITITAFQIASNLSMECYALTFGINTFVALSLQTIITVIFVDETALGLDIVTQFIVYGSYYAVISVLFLIRGTYTACVNSQIFPVWTYSYLSVLVPVFLLTDWLRYKPVVVFQCVALFITTAMLLWTKTVPAGNAGDAVRLRHGDSQRSGLFLLHLQVVWLRGVVDLKRYRKATSYSRSVQLLGYTVGSVLGQLLVSFNLMSYNNILVLTLVLTAVALLTSCFLPMPQQSMFFHRRPQETTTERSEDGGGDARERPSGLKASLEDIRDDKVEKGGTKDEAGKGLDEKGPNAEESFGAGTCGQVLLQLWRDFCQCYSSRQLLYWSVWWAMATCGYNQTVNYVQVLWEHVQPSQNFSIYNGGVEALSNLMGAATAYGIGFTEVRWEQWGELALGGFSGLGAAALFFMTFIGNIWVCYAGYVIFKCLYMLLITIAMYQIAADLSMERYALVFGANNFGALALQTIITSVVVDSGGLGLGIIDQFTIYSSYFSVIAVVFSLRGLFTIWSAKRSSKDSTPPVKNEPPDFDEHRF
ncbi:hypothetical protein L3Q82_018914, partial [Scortum barcoo]